MPGGSGAVSSGPVPWPLEPAADVRYGWPLRLAALITVLTYVVTGIAKLRYAGGDWVSGDTLLNQIAFDNARKKVLGDAYSPLAARSLSSGRGSDRWVRHPRGRAGAPVALLGRRWARVVGGGVVLHVGILALMAIGFPYPLSLIAFAPFFRCERPFEWVLDVTADVDGLLRWSHIPQRGG